MVQFPKFTLQLTSIIRSHFIHSQTKRGRFVLILSFLESGLCSFPLKLSKRYHTLFFSVTRLPILKASYWCFAFLPEQHDMVGDMLVVSSKPSDMIIRLTSAFPSTAAFTERVFTTAFKNVDRKQQLVRLLLSILLKLYQKTFSGHRIMRDSIRLRSSLGQFHRTLEVLWKPP